CEVGFVRPADRSEIRVHLNFCEARRIPQRLEQAVEAAVRTERPHLHDVANHRVTPTRESAEAVHAGGARSHLLELPFRRSIAAPQRTRNVVMKACSFAGSTARGASASATASATW